MSVFNYYARYYDLLYKDKNYQSEAKYIESLILKNNPQAKTILNLGCGTGKHDLLLAEMGYHITGVDLSHTMIEQAIKNKAKHSSSSENSNFVQGDIREVRLDKKFDIVVSLFHVMSYQISNQDLIAAIETAKSHLKPGGIFIFDAWYGPAVLTDKPVVRVKRLKDEQLEVTRIAEPFIHSNENIVDVNYSLIIKDKEENSYHEFKETHRMRYFFKPEIEFFLNKSDFSLIDFEEWMSGKVPDYSWNVCFVCKSID